MCFHIHIFFISFWIYSQELFERKVQLEEEAKLKRKEEKGNFSIDYDFSELDMARAVAKLVEASTKYDRSLPGCKSLDCFEVDHLGPGAFRDALKRTFNLHFTDREMGTYDTYLLLLSLFVRVVCLLLLFRYFDFRPPDSPSFIFICCYCFHRRFGAKIW